MTHDQLPLILPREPQKVDPQTIAQIPSMTRAIVLSADMAGLENDKDQARTLGIDASTWSLIKQGQRAFPHDRYEDLFNEFGNEIPLLFLLHRRGYDLNSLRKRESETERLLREEREAREKVEAENKLLRDLLKGGA